MELMLLRRSLSATSVVLLAASAPSYADAQDTPAPALCWPAALGQPSWMSSPARFALEIRDSLGLTPVQVAALELRARAERDSSAVRAARIRARKMRSGRPTMPTAGPTSDRLILGDALESMGVAPETVIGMARDRQAVGEILTAPQRDTMDRLWTATMRRVVGGPAAMRP